jgi:hypothetical protein
VTDLLGMLAAIATLACGGALVFVHMRSTGYDPVRDAVSDYGVGRYRRWYTAATVTLGAAAILLAIAIAATVRPEPVLLIVLLVVFGLARVAIVRFPVDLDRRPPSRSGQIHRLLAAVAFVAIAIVAAELPLSVLGDPGWTGVEGALRTVGWLVVAAALATGLGLRLASLRPFFGLLERLLYVAMLTWFMTVSLHIA